MTDAFNETVKLCDRLTDEEIYSLLKSNRFSWELRRIIKFKISLRRIKQYTPLIAVVVSTATIIGIINKFIKHGGEKNGRK